MKYLGLIAICYVCCTPLGYKAMVAEQPFTLEVSWNSLFHTRLYVFSLRISLTRGKWVNQKYFQVALSAPVSPFQGPADPGLPPYSISPGHGWWAQIQKNSGALQNPLLDTLLQGLGPAKSLSKPIDRSTLSMILHSVLGEGNPISSEPQRSHLAVGWVLAAVIICPKMILSFVVVYNEIMLDMSCMQSFPAYLNYDRASNCHSKEGKHFRCR